MDFQLIDKLNLSKVSPCDTYVKYSRNGSTYLSLTKAWGKDGSLTWDVSIDGIPVGEFIDGIFEENNTLLNGEQKRFLDQTLKSSTLNSLLVDRQTYVKFISPIKKVDPLNPNRKIDTYVLHGKEAVSFFETIYREINLSQKIGLAYNWLKKNVSYSPQQIFKFRGNSITGVTLYQELLISEYLTLKTQDALDSQVFLNYPQIEEFYLPAIYGLMKRKARKR